MSNSSVELAAPPENPSSERLAKLELDYAIRRKKPSSPGSQVSPSLDPPRCYSSLEK